MIKVLFFKEQDLFVGFKSIGHAGQELPDTIKRQLDSSDQYGNIICSAVSILVYHIEIGLLQIEGLNENQIFIKDNKGNFELKILDKFVLFRVQKYFLNFLLTLKQLQKQYQNTIIIEEAFYVT